MSFTFTFLSFWMQLGALSSLAAPPAEPSKPAVQESKPIAPQPVDVSEIAERLRETASVVRGASLRAAPLDKIVVIERGLPQFAKVVDELAAYSRGLLKTTPAPGVITELTSAWTANRRELDRWQSTLKDRSGALQVDFNALRRAADVWTLTRAGSTDQQLPAEVTSSIDQTLAEIAKTQQTVLARRNAILTIQNQVSALRVEVDRVAEELAVVDGAQRNELLQFDSPPIWRVTHLARPRAAATHKPAEDSAPFTEGLRYYMRIILVGLFLQSIAFCLLLAGLLLLRRRAAEWLLDKDDSVRAAGAVVKRPFSAALLLTVLGGSVFRGEAPEFITELAGYLMLIPLLRLMPKIISNEIKPSLWLLAGLYFADRNMTLLPDYSLAARCAVLLLAATTAGGLWWLDRRLRAQRSPGGWLSLTLVFIRTGIALLLIAFLAEVSGATLLSGFLLSGVLDTVYGAVLLYGAMLILQGFMRIVLRSRRLESALSMDELEAILMGRFSRGLNYLAFIAFLALVVKSFSLGVPLSTVKDAVFSHQISIGAVAFSLGSAVTFALVLVAAIAFSRALRFFLSASVFARIDLQRGIAESISKILHYSIVLAGFFFALGAAGIDLSKFTVLAGAFGVGLAFGMQNIVNNFVSGLILLFERPLHVGDNITVGSTSGQVSDIGIRASTIRTWDGADVIMPNGTLISNEVTNWTLSDSHRRCELRVGVAYGTDPELVIRLLKETVSEHPLVRMQPAPTAHAIRFGDSSIDFVARFWAHVDQHVDVTSEIHVAVCKRLAGAGVEIPFPQRDLNLRHVDPAVMEALIPKRPGPGC